MLRSLALFLCCASAAATSASTEYAAAYAGKSEDMLSGKYSLYWRTTATHLEIAINALTPGWVAFGLAEQTSGTMGGSDIVTVHFDTAGTPIATDTFAEDKSGLKTDTQQDWVVVKGTKTAGATGSIAVELTRLLDTKDGSDRALTRTPLDNTGRGTRVVVAYGGSATVGYHSANRAGVLLPIMQTGTAVDALAEYRSNAEYVEEKDVCVRVCVCVCTCVCVCVYVCVCMHIRMYTYIHTYVHINIRTRIYVCIHVYMYMYT